MNKEKYLLLCLIEECNEIEHRACKAIRFGLNEKQPGQDKTNAQRLHDEINDLMGVISLLNQQFDFKYEPSVQAMQDKQKRLEKYYRYSKSKGESK